MADPNVSVDPVVDAPTQADADAGLLSAILTEVFGSYINMALVLVIGVLLYKILRGRSDDAQRRSTPPAPQLPKLRRDFTIQELKPFDGTQPDGRVLMAVNGTVYDVTKGKSFYGPGECVGLCVCVCVWCFRVCVCLRCVHRETGQLVDIWCGL